MDGRHLAINNTVVTINIIAIVANGLMVMMLRSENY